MACKEVRVQLSHGNKRRRSTAEEDAKKREDMPDERGTQAKKTKQLAVKAHPDDAKPR